MVELERRISGDWIDAREASTDQYVLTHFFQLTSERLHDIARNLRLTVEEGILEFKGSLLRPVFLSLEAMQFQSVRFEELQTHEQPLADLLFIILLQRLFCSGAIPSAKIKLPQPISAENLEVNAILTDIKNRIKLKPEFQKHPAVKNIFMQVAIYQKERKKLQDLLPTIKEDKRETFRQNFRDTFRNIFDSIRKNYANILSEDEARRMERENQSEVLYRLSLKNLTTLLNNQAKEASRLRSTLAYAREDKYKTRSFLVSLYREKRHFLGLIDKETSAYRKLCEELSGNTEIDCAATLGKRLRDELVRILEKLARLEAPPQ